MKKFFRKKTIYLLTLLILCTFFLVSCPPSLILKITIEVINQLPDTISVSMYTTETFPSDPVEIVPGSTTEVAHSYGNGNTQKNFYLLWGATSDVNTSTWMTNNGGYWLGGTTLWLSAKDCNAVTITYVGSLTDITYDTYTTE